MGIKEEFIMTIFTIMTVVLAVLAFVSAILLSCQIYKLVELDAKSRGLKHPKLWGLFSISGSNGNGGLILYLIGRKKYPSHMDEEEKQQLASYKKRAGIMLCLLAGAAIGLILLVVNQA